MSIYQLHKKQKINTSVDELWDFISTPENLKRITPEAMGFEIISENLKKKIYPGMIISYHVKPMLNIKTLWVTEITQLKEKEFFIDEQRVGPYKIWHHQHFLEPIEGGVLMRDIITYKPPFGILGSLINNLFIKKRLDEIFYFRKLKLDEIYGSF